MKKIKIGDIFEIRTPSGLAYGQYTHHHAGSPKYGALIRILPGLFVGRPCDLSTLAEGPSKFVTFFPLQAAVNKGIVVVVGNYAIPTSAKEFPIFRSGVVNTETGKVDLWWLWDGDKEWQVGALSVEQRRLPIRGVINDSLLIERIISGWTPEDDPTT